jgi:septin family protein
MMGPRCEELHSQIQPLNDRLKGPLERQSHKTTALPFVLLLGNHSSGKSSFINYVLDRQIQQSGVAPTDDSFTIIAPGSIDVDQDGPKLLRIVVAYILKVWKVTLRCRFRPCFDW